MLLPAVEPIHHSKANLRSSKDAASPRKRGLLSLLRFATGFPTDFLLAGRHNCEHRLIALCQRRALGRGRGVLNVSLPSSWEEEGRASRR